MNYFTTDHYTLQLCFTDDCMHVARKNSIKQTIKWQSYHFNSHGLEFVSFPERPQSRGCRLKVKNKINVIYKAAINKLIPNEVDVAVHS